jgi:biotin transporter BioY
MRPGVLFILLLILLGLQLQDTRTWSIGTHVLWGIAALLIGSNLPCSHRILPTPSTLLPLMIHVNAGLLPGVAAQAAICLFVFNAAHWLPIAGVVYTHNKRGYLAGFIYATLLETLFLTLETSRMMMLFLFATAQFWILLLGAVYYVKQTEKTKYFVWDLMLPDIWPGWVQCVVAVIWVQCLRPAANIME